MFFPNFTKSFLCFEGSILKTSIVQGSSFKSSIVSSRHKRLHMQISRAGPEFMTNKLVTSEITGSDVTNMRQMSAKQFD